MRENFCHNMGEVTGVYQVSPNVTKMGHESTYRRKLGFDHRVGHFWPLRMTDALSTAFLKNGHKAYPFSYNWLREQPCIAESGMQTSLREQAPAKAHFSRVCRPVDPWSYGQKHDGFQLNVHF